MGSDLRGLIERLEKATGPDRELDGAMWLHFDQEALYKCWGVRGMRYAGHVHTKAEKAAHIKRMSEYYAPAYTASLDAAVALVERVAPGWSWECRASGTGDKGQATIWNPSRRPGDNDQQRVYNCASPAIALCLALLRSQEQSPEQPMSELARIGQEINAGEEARE